MGRISPFLNEIAFKKYPPVIALFHDLIIDGTPPMGESFSLPRNCAGRRRTGWWRSSSSGFVARMRGWWLHCKPAAV